MTISDIAGSHRQPTIDRFSINVITNRQTRIYERVSIAATR